MAKPGKFEDLTLNAKPSVEIDRILERGLIVDIDPDILNIISLGPLQTSLLEHISKPILCMKVFNSSKDTDFTHFRDRTR